MTTLETIRNMEITMEEAELIARAARYAAPIYAAEGWKWGGWGDECFVPTEGDIRRKLVRLVEGMGDCLPVEGIPRLSASSGRLMVSRCEDNGHLTISVELGSHDCWKHGQGRWGE